MKKPKDLKGRREQFSFPLKKLLFWKSWFLGQLRKMQKNGLNFLKNKISKNNIFLSTFSLN